MQKSHIYYIIYIRKSTDEVARRQVLSLSAQLFELKKFAVTNNLPIIGVVRESKTAKRPGRVQFDAMLDRIEKGMGRQIGILSWSPDRLSRNKVDETRLSELLESGKLSDLKFPTHAFANTPSGKFFLSIQMANAKYYIDQLSENIIRGQAEKLRGGAWPGSKPFGFRYSKLRGNIVPCPRRAPLVRQLYDHALATHDSIPLLTAWFNVQLGQAGLRERFKRNGVARILHNRLYIGVMAWRDKVYEGDFEKVVTPSVFKRVQQHLAHRTHAVRRNTHQEFPYRGLFKCSCSAPITAQIGRGRGGTYRYYRCTRRHGPCREPYIREETLHDQAITALTLLRLPKVLLEDLREHLSHEAGRLQEVHQARVQELGKQIETINSQLEKLVDLHLSNHLDETTFRSRHDQLVEARLSAKSAYSETNARFPALWFEHAEQLIEPLNRAAKLSSSSNHSEISTLLQKIGSNHTISSKKVTVSWGGFYRVVASLSHGSSSQLVPASTPLATPKSSCPLLRSLLDAVRTQVQLELSPPVQGQKVNDRSVGDPLDPSTSKGLL